MTTDQQQLRATVEKAVEDGNGIVRLRPAWVARAFLPPGRRLDLPESQYELGERGGICERWLASTTQADNRVGVAKEGLSILALESHESITLKEAVEAAAETILGAEYAASHPRGLDRLAKIFDYEYRIPYHLHQMKQHAALVGRNPKEEAYYFPEGVPMGKEPESYFGVHPSISEENRQDVLLPHLEQWESDLILQHSRAYKLVPGDGWHIPAGILHAPGSALTIELQEDSDVFAMLQAKAGGRIISKDLLFKDVRPEDRQSYGERFILQLIDWKANGDHYFYENRHTPPLLIENSKQAGGDEHWIFYNTLKFSGKKLVVRPHQTYESVDAGVYNALIWRGRGRFDGHIVEGGHPQMDELLISFAKATQPLVIENSGSEDLVVFKFFGPDVNPNVPMLNPFGSKSAP
ncbi:MAG TPA: hypothetical protein DCP63_04810 [Bacteroidetes bacterium]|nr:hypothetical protein [Bacteroidota bacterium]